MCFCNGREANKKSPNLSLFIYFFFSYASTIDFESSNLIIKDREWREAKRQRALAIMELKTELTKAVERGRSE